MAPRGVSRIVGSRRGSTGCAVQCSAMIEAHIVLQAFDVTLHGRQGRVCLFSEPRCIEPAGYLHPENLALVMTSKGSECSVRTQQSRRALGYRRLRRGIARRRRSRTRRTFFID